MADILLSPWLWVILLGLWLWWWWTGRSRPHIHRKYDSKYKHRFKAGDLFADGSTATSKTEKRVLESLHRHGYRTLPSSTRILIPEVATRPDGESQGKKGATRMFTPDIMLLNKKVIVEVDPIHWHGGEERIIHDLERNMGYSALGYAVVRVRIGWADQPYSRLGPFDVVTHEQDYDADRHAARVIKQVSKAKPLNPQFWAREHARLTRNTRPDPRSRR